MKKFFAILILPIILFSLFLIDSSFAANDLSGAVNQQIGAGAQGAELGEAVDPRVFIAELIQVALTLVGTFFMGLVVLGGYWWLTDRGEEERVEKAKKTLTAAVIGLIVVLTAYAITTFAARLTQQSVRGETLQPSGVRVRCGIIDAVRGNCNRNDYSQVY